MNIKLNPSQREAAKHTQGPALVLAIPGSGKTTLLIYRTIYLVEVLKVDPARILTLTFSKAAALDMNTRYQQLFNRNYKLGFSTIHRFCYSVLLNYFRQIGREYTLIETKDAPITKQQLLRKLYYKVNHAPINDDVFEELTSGIGYVKNMMLAPETYESNVENFQKIFEAYEAYKKEERLIDFDDMLTMCYTLFDKKPEILKYYQSKFDYIQVDECQDTSKIQHAIIQLLASHKNIYMVADDDQSIYGFRGAYPEVIVNIDQHYPGIKIYQLQTNYRSSGQIIDVCKNIIANNQIRHRKNYDAHHDMEAELNLVYTDTTYDQAKYIIEAHKASNENQAILFRNSLSLVTLVNQLDRQDVDFVVKDPSNNFFKHFILLDILAFMKLALAPNDLEVFERIYYKMNAFISKEKLHQLKAQHTGINVFEGLLQVSGQEKFQIATLRKFKANFDYLSKLKPDLAIEFIESELNYKNFLTENSKKRKISPETQNKYLDVLKALAHESDSLVDFLKRLEDLREIIFRASKNTNPHAIKLYTMHGAKGLEFDHVFIIDMDQYVFPSKYAVDQKKQGDLKLYEEERRLFYVALSRAKSKITLVHTKFKNGQYNKPSEFVEEYIKACGELLKSSSYSKPKSHFTDHGFEIGEKVLHTSFGLGYIIDLDEDRIMIEFKKETKTLSASIIKDSKILIKIDD